MSIDIKNTKKIDNNLALTTKILKENKIPFWLCGGTLLGIFRDKKLIEHDSDIDLAIWDNAITKERLIEIMIANNFKPEKKFFFGDGICAFHKDGGKNVDIHFYEVLYNKFLKKDVAIVFQNYLPKNIFMKFIDAVSISNNYNGKFKYLIKVLYIFQPFFKFIKSILVKKKMFYNAIGNSEPLELLKDFKKIDFFGFELRIPSRTEEYLKFIYGDEWKVPDSNFHYYHYMNENAGESEKIIIKKI